MGLPSYITNYIKSLPKTSTIHGDIYGDAIVANNCQVKYYTYSGYVQYESQRKLSLEAELYFEKIYALPDIVRQHLLNGKKRRITVTSRNSRDGGQRSSSTDFYYTQWRFNAIDFDFDLYNSSYNSILNSNPKWRLFKTKLTELEKQKKNAVVLYKSALKIRKQKDARNKKRLDIYNDLCVVGNEYEQKRQQLLEQIANLESKISNVEYKCSKNFSTYISTLANIASTKAHIEATNASIEVITNG